MNGKRSVHYFADGQKQADGRWKWVCDGGVDSDPSHAPGPSVPVVLLPAGDARAIGPAVAMQQVKAAELALATWARADVAAAYGAALAADAYMQGSNLAPATSPAAVAAELATRSKAIDFAPLGGSASKAGDLAWTYGEARWTGGRGYYVRIWQRRASAWKIVFDQIVDVPPPPAKP